MALFLAVGALFGLGQKNKVTNNYETTINQSIQDTMSAEINAKTTSICSNEINIIGSTCCKFQFGNQYCESSAINEVIADVTFQRNLRQDVFDSVIQTATASNEKLGFGQENDVSNIVKKTMDLSMQTAQVFNTDCSKQAYGSNTQNYKDVYCGQNPDGTCQNTSATPDFVSGDQTSKVSALGNCAARFAANNDISQSLTSMAEQTATAKNVGVDPLALMLSMILPIIVILCIPLGLKFVQLTLRKMDRSQVKTPDQEKVYKAKKRYGTLAFVTIVIILIYMVAIWPLGYSYANGYAPFEGLDYREQARVSCDLSSGTALKELNVINRFMWIDPYCLTLGASNTSGCSSTQQQKSYATCGIYAKQNGCKSALLDQHKTKYAAILNACSPLGFLENDRTAKCDALTLSKYILPRTVMGNLCRRCENRQGDEAKYFGLFAGVKDGLSDADKKDCEASDKELPDKCFNSCSGTGFSTTQYYAAGTETINGQQVKKVCAQGDTNCIAKSEYKTLFPQECQSEDYMEAKGKFLEYQKYCLAVNLAAAKQAPAGETLLLSEQCPPNPFDYFTSCNSSTFECTYTAQNTSDANEVAACKNDFTLCTDKSYLADKTVQQNLDTRCADKKKQIETYEKERLEMPVVFGCILGFLVVVFLFFVVKASQEIPILSTLSNAFSRPAKTSAPAAAPSKKNDSPPPPPPPPPPKPSTDLVEAKIPFQ